MANSSTSRLERRLPDPQPPGQEPEPARRRSRLTDRPMLERAERVLEETARTADFEPAPGRLALGIMARLAQQPEAQPRPANRSLALALALAVLVLLPLLGAIGWLILNGITNPALLSDWVQRGMELLALLWNTLHAIAADARALVMAYPELPLLSALLPIGVFGIQRAARRQRHRLMRDED